MNNHQEWPFDQAPNVAAFTTRQVLDLQFPILHVTHYEDDHSWAFLCGSTDDYAEDGRLICMSEALELDESLEQIADLPPGWSAQRKNRESEWVRYKEDEG